MAGEQRAADETAAGKVECRICGGSYRSLGHHVRRAHGMSADDYRDLHGLRHTQPLTSTESRRRWQDRIAMTIAAGSLDEHYAGNAARAAVCRSKGHQVMREMRERGVTFRPSRAPRPREELVAIVAAIEAGSKRVDALAAGSISDSAFYAALRRHPDLKARMAKVAARKARRRVADRPPGRVAGSELGRIVAAIAGRYPTASLLVARIAIALLDAADRTMTVSDLSDALGKGRDSTAVQDAIARLEAIGLVRRELRPADEHGGRAWAVTLATDAI